MKIKHCGTVALFQPAELARRSSLAKRGERKPRRPQRAAQGLPREGTAQGAAGEGGASSTPRDCPHGWARDDPRRDPHGPRRRDPCGSRRRGQSLLIRMARSLPFSPLGCARGTLQGRATRVAAPRRPRPRSCPPGRPRGGPKGRPEGQRRSGTSQGQARGGRRRAAPRD